MTTFFTEYAFGVKSELDCFDAIKNFIDCDLKRSEKRGATFDFYSDNSLVELKTRKNNYRTYPTTMVGYNKIEYANKFPEKNIYFVFKFLDGLYYYKYNKDDKLDFGLGGRRDRGRDEIKDYCYIPIELLKKIDLENK